MLAEFKEYLGDSIKVQAMLQDIEALKQQASEKPSKLIEITPFNQYKRQIRDMRDEKIMDMIDFENKNAKLAQLVDSGFLDTSFSSD